MTVLAGFIAFRNGEINHSGKPITLKQGKQMIAVRELPSYGEITGYPKLPLGFWDDEDFFVMPILIIFKGLTGADPAWLETRLAGWEATAALQLSPKTSRRS